MGCSYCKLLVCSPRDAYLPACCLVRCSGGVATNRSEAFVLGTPLHEIAIALSLSKKSEIMLAPSAVHHWTPPDSPDWTQQTLPTGHLVMSRAASRSRMLQRSRSVESPLGLVEQTAEPKPRRPAYTEAIGDKSKDEFVSAKMRQERLIDEVVSFMDDMETAECILSSGRSLALSDLDEMLQGGPPSPDNSTTGMPTHCLPDSMGLGDLLPFLPEFVRKKCLSGQHTLSTLMEHRSVTVLFIIADMQVRLCPSLPGSRSIFTIAKSAATAPPRRVWEKRVNSVPGELFPGCPRRSTGASTRTAPGCSTSRRCWGGALTWLRRRWGVLRGRWVVSQVVHS